MGSQAQAKTVLEEIKSSQTRRGDKCLIVKILEEVDEPTREGLKAALDDMSGVYGATISKWLKTKGYAISPGSIQRHRRKVCTCE